MKKLYMLKPTMTFNSLTNVPASHKPCLPAASRLSAAQAGERAVDEIVNTIMPSLPAEGSAQAGQPAAVPAHQPRFVPPPPRPLPCASLVADRPALKLGLDVHLEFIMVVAQRGHLSPQAPRKFTPEQLVEQVKRWTAEGLAVHSPDRGIEYTLLRQVWLLARREEGA